MCPVIPTAAATWPFVCVNAGPTASDAATD